MTIGMDRLVEAIQLASKVKAVLLKKGKRKGWTKCPRCGGRINAVLAGPRNHIHMACETPSCIRMVE